MRCQSAGPARWSCRTVSRLALRCLYFHGTDEIGQSRLQFCGITYGAAQPRSVCSTDRASASTPSLSRGLFTIRNGWLFDSRSCSAEGTITMFSVAMFSGVRKPPRRLRARTRILSRRPRRPTLPTPVKSARFERSQEHFENSGDWIGPHTTERVYRPVRARIYKKAASEGITPPFSKAPLRFAWWPKSRLRSRQNRTKQRPLK